MTNSISLKMHFLEAILSVGIFFCIYVIKHATVSVRLLYHQINPYHPLGKISRQQFDDIFLFFFFFFPQKTEFDISCNKSPLETICIKFQNLFSGKKKKNFKMLSAEIFTHCDNH